MPKAQRQPGQVRDAILKFFKNHRGEATIDEIYDAVTTELGEVARSSVRSYMQVESKFERIGRGKYRLRGN